ncbi:hypothetical protein KEM55_004428, partial [Ascosphaera atra]
LSEPSPGLKKDAFRRACAQVALAGGRDGWVAHPGRPYPYIIHPFSSFSRYSWLTHVSITTLRRGVMFGYPTKRWLGEYHSPTVLREQLMAAQAQHPSDETRNQDSKAAAQRSPRHHHVEQARPQGESTQQQQQDQHQAQHGHARSPAPQAQEQHGSRQSTPAGHVQQHPQQIQNGVPVTLPGNPGTAASNIDPAMQAAVAAAAAQQQSQQHAHHAEQPPQTNGRVASPQPPGSVPTNATLPPANPPYPAVQQGVPVTQASGAHLPQQQPQVQQAQAPQSQPQYQHTMVVPTVAGGMQTLPPGVQPQQIIQGQIPATQVPQGQIVHPDGSFTAIQHQQQDARRYGKRELSTSRRAEQNRVAQRAFRQRKETHIRELEAKVKAFERMQENFRSLQAENYQLREYIIGLQSRLLETQGEVPEMPHAMKHPITTPPEALIPIGPTTSASPPSGGDAGSPGATNGNHTSNGQHNHHQQQSSPTSPSGSAPTQNHHHLTATPQLQDIFFFEVRYGH